MRITDLKYVKCLAHSKHDENPIILIKYFHVVNLTMDVFNTGTVNNLSLPLSMITNLSL